MRTLGQLLDRAEQRNWISLGRVYLVVGDRAPEGDSEKPDEGLPDELEEEGEDD